MSTPVKSDPYRLEADGTFVIRDYNRQKPFSNFLPGIAGLFGTPMWTFYVNRGQGVASFGTKNKDNAILEFFPANKAYQNVTTLGFRTFLKVRDARGAHVHEPFRDPSPWRGGHAPEQTMEIRSHEFGVRETNKTLGIETTSVCFTIPGEPIAALARELTVTNVSDKQLTIEILDGLPQVNPFGMNEFFVKNMSRTIEAWMAAENLEKKAAYFRLKVDATDRPEVTFIEEGNFYFASLAGRGLVDPIVDPAAVFGTRLDFSEPVPFYASEGPFKPARQITENRTPCAFSYATVRLAPGRSARLRTFAGQASNLDLLNRYSARASAAGYFEEKRAENARTIDAVKGRIFTATSSPAYDLYCGQTYLDNVLRGGLPVPFGEKGKPGQVFYVFSRKHGDLERDYNRFLVEPTYFSQGDGNYRDVNQNRRSDTWFEPAVRDTNVRIFLNLLQTDGYNPLVVKGTTFRFAKSGESKRVLERFLGSKGAARAAEIGSKPFSPGELCRSLEAEGFLKKDRFSAFLSALAPGLAREEKAEHGEGFWIDHWTYNLDLIENYLSIYPEDAAALLFVRREYSFHDSDHYVRPRDEKGFAKKPGIVRQYRSVKHDKDKSALIASRREDASLVRSRNGNGPVFRTTLFAKLTTLVANRAASLDPEGVGIEMEADKPSWYDALNGLPGLFGSSLCETFELKRLCVFMIQALDDAGGRGSVALPVEVYDFVWKLKSALERHFSDRAADRNLQFWNEASSAKEAYRKRVFRGLSGKEKDAPYPELKIFLERVREKLDIGIERAFDPTTGLYPTYFENRVTKTARAKAPDRVRPVAFEQKALPFFLEGPVHALKVEKDPSRRKALVRAVRQSALYDKKLSMYKVNAPLAPASLEIGRARVFAPGWLENESIWLHMEYKFLLELLKAGLCDEFYEDFKKALVPFQPAARYGRSPLENSSFIASSAFVDPAAHGTGFVARLSGSTAEFLSMWLLMNVGRRPFSLGPDGRLSLRFQPTLPGWLFTTDRSVRTYADKEGNPVRIDVPKDAVAFLFLGKTIVVYRNNNRLDTYGRSRASVRKLTLTTARGERLEFKGDTIPHPHAAAVRDGFVPRIDVDLG